MNVFFRRNSVFFYLSFFSAGTQSLVTQLFVKNYYPEKKELVLPLILLLGSCALILGIFTAGRCLKFSSRIIRLVLPVHLLTFALLLVTTTLPLYIGLYMISCFSCNFAFNYLDHYFIGISSQADHGRHVQTLLLYQMLGFILSPLYFSFISGPAVRQIPAIVVLAVICSLPALQSTVGGNAADVPLPLQETEKSKSWEAGAGALLLYTLLFMTIVAVTLSQFTYFVSEYYRLSGYAQKSGLCLMLMSLTACVSILLFPSAGPPAGNSPSPFTGRQYGITGITLILCFLILLRIWDSFLFLLLVSLVLGGAYGIFLNSTRKLATYLSVNGKNPGYLNLFNHLQSISYISAYGLTSLWGFIALYLNANFYTGILILIMVLLAGELIIVSIMHKQFYVTGQERETKEIS